MINLSTYTTDIKNRIHQNIWLEFGLDTANVVSNFVQEFDFENYDKTQTLDDMFRKYANAKTAINNKDLFEWLLARNSSINYINKLFKSGIVNVHFDSFNILNVIRTAQNLEIYDALCVTSNWIKLLLVTNYLLHLDYSQVHQDFLEKLFSRFHSYEEINFESLMNDTFRETDATETTFTV